MKQAIIDTWGEFWNARTQREKTILMWAGSWCRHRAGVPGAVGTRV